MTVLLNEQQIQSIEERVHSGWHGPDTDVLDLLGERKELLERLALNERLVNEVIHAVTIYELKIQLGFVQGIRRPVQA